MNKQLALFFDDHALYAAIEPFEGKFKLLGLGQPPKYALFFLVGDLGIQYGQGFERDVRNGSPGAYGDLYTLLQRQGSIEVNGYERDYIDLLEPILNDLTDQYDLQIGELSDSIVDKTAPIPVTLAFADAVPADVRPRLTAYLRRFRLAADPEAGRCLPAYLIRHLLLKRRIPAEQGIYGVVEALGDTLHLSIVEANGTGNISRKAHQSYPGMGADPRLGALAKYVVDELNRTRHLLDNDTLLQAEYSYQLPYAVQWNEDLAKTRRPHIDIRTYLSAYPDSPGTVTIQKTDIDNLTRTRSRQVSRYFESLTAGQYDMEKFDRLIVLGDSMNNEFVLEGFNSLGRDRILVLDSSCVEYVLMGMHTSGQQVRVEVPVRIPGDLQPGDTVEFTWDPSRLVRAIYNGGQRFTIIAHQNSKIVTGDSFLLDGELKLGARAIMRNIIRPPMPHPIGDYKSGEITAFRKL
ncbi:MAG: hypothetical protein OHK0039_40280 [Bacteroidia bacterium]